MNKDIRALEAHNTSERPPYLYYLHTKDLYNELREQSPTANIDSAGNRAKEQTFNPKSADDVNPAKKNNEDRGKTSHNSKKLKDSKKFDNNKKSNETKKSGDNKKFDNNKRFDYNQKLDDLKKSKKIKTSEKELNTGNEPSPPKNQSKNIKAFDESKNPESNNKATLKSPIQPDKKAVHFPDPEHDAIVPEDQSKEGPDLEPKPVKRMSQVFGAEHRLPNTSIKGPLGQATKSKSSPHKQINLPKRELTVGLKALLKKTAYIVGGYEEAYECLFRTQKDGQDLGSGECSTARAAYPPPHPRCPRGQRLGRPD